MLNAILKFGSMIVDALTEYAQPVFIYLPPYAELRGGAWVVMDPQIHPAQMEIYADPTSRAGVLEPEGVIEIKFRAQQLRSLMERTDPGFASLKQSIGTELVNRGDQASADSLNSSQEKLAEREKQLTDVYHQVAVHFADLHDRPQRMLQKGCIRDIVPWAGSRRYFIRRLRERLHLPNA